MGNSDEKMKSSRIVCKLIDFSNVSNVNLLLSFLCDCLLVFGMLMQYGTSVYLLWLPCIADADIIFSSCSLFFFLFFLASSQLSQIGVALVQIYNALLKGAARGSLQIQDAKMTQKNCHLRTITQLCRVMSS